MWREDRLWGNMAMADSMASLNMACRSLAREKTDIVASFKSAGGHSESMLAPHVDKVSSNERAIPDASEMEV